MEKIYHGKLNYPLVCTEKGIYIGSDACIKCNHLKGFDTEEGWIKCQQIDDYRKKKNKLQCLMITLLTLFHQPHDASLIESAVNNYCKEYIEDILKEIENDPYNRMSIEGSGFNRAIALIRYKLNLNNK